MNRFLRAILCSVAAILCAHAAAQTSAGTTIIVHGFNSGTRGWVSSLGEAVRSSVGGNLHTLTLFDSAPYVFASPPLEPNARQILLVDWSRMDSFVLDMPFAVSYRTEQVAAYIDEYLLANAPYVYQGPIHLIGHSRGGSLVMALAERLGRRGVWVDHQTTLDRHPVLGSLSTPIDFAKSGVGSNVVFADDYFSIGEDNRAPEGYPTAGAYQRDLSAFVDGTRTAGGCGGFFTNDFFVTAHTQVHAYYHGTVDKTAVCDGDGTKIEPNWFTGTASRPLKSQVGFAHARKMGTTNLSEVPWPASGISAAFGSGLLAGSAARDVVTLDTAATPWPNVMAAPQATYQFTAGQEVPIPYIYQRQGSVGMDVVIQLDNDTNPYNEVPSSSPCRRTIATIPHSSSVAPQKATFNWLTSSIDRVPGCYVLLIARTYTSTVPAQVAQARFDYLPSALFVSAPSPANHTTTFSVPANYPSGQDVTQTLAVPGAQNLAVTINGSLSHGDYFIITDQNGNLLRELTGTVAQSFNVVGSQIRVRFVGTSCCGGGLGSGYSGSGASVSVAPTGNLAADTTPDSFRFQAIYGARPGYSTVSNSIQVSGINSPSPVTVTNGYFRVNGGAWRTMDSVSLGDRIEVLVVNALGAGATATATLTVGAFSTTFSVTTVDFAPDPFRFTPQHYVPLSTMRTSECVLIAGIAGTTPLTIAGGEYQLGCSGPYSTDPLAVTSGQTIRVRHSSAASPGTMTQTRLCVGGVCSDFRTTTAGGVFVCNLDVNGDGATSAEFDGVLLLRHLLGFRDAGLVSGIPLGTLRPTQTDVTSFLANVAQFDVFGRASGTPALSDGIVLARLMRNIDDQSLLRGIPVPGSATNQNASSVRAFVNQRCGTAF
jgi:pimeloyl-ACP methyl ester carboxylesterase